jgi:hypothetical protein
LINKLANIYSNTGKHNYDFWKDIFDIGKSPDGMSQVLTQPINFIEMIKSDSEE